MFERLGEIYLPLVGWTLAGLLLLRSSPEWLPQFLGRALYWVGVPIQVFGFMQRADLTNAVWLVPGVVVASLAFGTCLGWLVSRHLGHSERGDFLLAATLGNTGFVGLAIAPYLIDEAHLSWLVLYTISHNVLGAYGLGVAIASYFGDRAQPVPWTTHVRSVMLTPALWAFGAGVWQHLQGLVLPLPLANSLDAATDGVIPIAMILVGIRFRNCNWRGLQHALPAVAIKLAMLPLAVGLGVTLCGITGMPRLAMVLEAGMPTALAGVILAEEYHLKQDITLLSIALTSIGVLPMIPLWLWLFPT